MNHQSVGIAFSTISCPEYSFSQMADAVQRFEYDGIELYALEGERLTPELLDEHLNEARRALREIPIVCINSWGKLSSPDASERTRQEAQINRSFELASELRCPLVKTFGGELPTGHNREDAFDYMAESLRHLADRGGSLGVTLIVETHDGFCLGSDLAQLLARVEHPHFGALWDVHHPFRMGETTEQTDRYIGDRVAHVHIKDALQVDGAWKFVPLGEGTLPVQAVLSRLLARNYKGYVALDWEKMWHPEIPGPEQALPHHSAVLREYIHRAASSS